MYDDDSTYLCLCVHNVSREGPVRPKSVCREQAHKFLCKVCLQGSGFVRPNRGTIYSEVSKNQQLWSDHISSFHNLTQTLQHSERWSPCLQALLWI